MDASAYIDGFDQLWTTGENGLLIDVWVSVGQGKSGTSCQLTVADPTHEIAAKLIEHTLSNGGIQPLEPPASPTAGDTSATPISIVDGAEPVGIPQNRLLLVKACLAAGVTDDGQIAYILATAEHETGNYQFKVEQGSRAYFQRYEGREDIGNIHPGDGYKYRGRGYVQVTGRSTYAMWAKKLGIDCLNKPELLEQRRYAAPTLIIGMRDGLYGIGRPLSRYINGTTQDFYNARATVNGDKSKNGTKIANEAKAILKEVPALKAQAGGAAVVTKTPDTTTQAGTPSQTSDTNIVKGARLIVTLNDVTYEFFHQGTKPSDNGTTIIIGQDVRWVLNRRARSKTEQGVSLKQLAEKVAASHRVKLVWEAPEDFKYIHVDQPGITDYQLLERECSRCGLFISSKNNIITVKSLSNLTDSGVVLYPGLNLLSWEVEDKALSDEAEDAGSSVMQSENKVELDVATGQIAQTKPDIDPAVAKDVTGKPTKEPAGVIEPAQQSTADSMRGRVKRLKGLPSKFTIPLNKDSLIFEPLFAFITEGLPGVLSRVWCTDKVEHRVMEGVTILHAYSPVEVLDNSPTPVPGETPPLTGKPTASGYVRPVSGFKISSRAGKLRNVGTSPHCGEDIACPIGTPVIAMNEGVVSGVANFGNGQGGNCITITYLDGGQSRYMHMSEMYVKSGEKVARGKVVGKSGNSGGVDAHLHWDLKGYPKDSFMTGGRKFNYPSAVGLANLTEGQMT